ncbi:MAG: hypothetical protein PHP86_14385 [Nevskiales bacterium]|nr:hypothetical protein [Nevskiales bacterium]
MTIARLPAALSLAFLAGGCGQSGPLVLPPSDPVIVAPSKPTEPAAQPTPESDDGERDGTADQP